MKGVLGSAYLGSGAEGGTAAAAAAVAPTALLAWLFGVALGPDTNVWSCTATSALSGRTANLRLLLSSAASVSTAAAAAAAASESPVNFKKSSAAEAGLLRERRRTLEAHA